MMASNDPELAAHSLQCQSIDSPLHPVCWEVWAQRRSAPVWQAVALSLGFEPVRRIQRLLLVGTAVLAGGASGGESQKRIPGDHLSEYHEIPLYQRLRRNMEFSLRLDVAVDQLAAEAGGHEAIVRLADFATLAGRMGWTLPDQFPQQNTGASEQATTGEQFEDPNRLEPRSGETVSPSAPPVRGQEEAKRNRERLLRLYEEDVQRHGKKGAIQRLAVSEKTDRGNLGKKLSKARKDRDEARRAGALRKSLGA